MKRRQFLESAGIFLGGLFIAGCASDKPDLAPAASGSGPASDQNRGKVYVGKNDDPAAALKAAILAAGGLGLVVKEGSKVIIKPNAAWTQTPAVAATTDPAVVAALVELCKEAGAGQVTVFEHTIDRPSEHVLSVTGIGSAATKAGARVVTASRASDFITLDIPGGKLLKTDTLAREVAEADVIINVPKAKRHSATELTLSLKNLMGVNYNRQAWHTGPDLHQYIADYSTAVHVDLTVIDASRILLTNGPKGPGETKDPHEIIVAFDPVAADAYTCRLFDMDPKDVTYIQRAAELGLGEADRSKLQIVAA